MALSPKQRAFVDHYVTCRNGAEAARRAGYGVLSARVTASRLLTKDNIQGALKAREAALGRQVAIDKATVIAELRAAIEVAREKLDAHNMIRAWCEISKMLGLERSEPVKLVVSIESKALKAKLEALSTEELLVIAAGRQPHTPVGNYVGNSKLLNM